MWELGIPQMSAYTFFSFFFKSNHKRCSYKDLQNIKKKVGKNTDQETSTGKQKQGKRESNWILLQRTTTDRPAIERGESGQSKTQDQHPKAIPYVQFHPGISSNNTDVQ